MWRDYLLHDPLKPFHNINNKALKYFINKEFLEKDTISIKDLWNLKAAQTILKKQEINGSWKYPTTKIDMNSKENYNQIETYRQLGILVEKYGFTNQNITIKKAAEFLFNHQTEQGDFRGIYGTQYSPNYTAAIIEILIKAGYEDDPHIDKCFKWLISVRQNDGGWSIPIRTHNENWKEVMNSDNSLEPIKEKVFSHMITGIVLRAFAAHSIYKKSEYAKNAGELLISRFFKPDKYPDRRSKEYWHKVSFPFWFTDIISALDSLSLIEFNKDHPKIKIALKSLRNKQLENGFWDLKLLRSKDKFLNYWINIAICRIFKRFFKDQ